MSILHAALPSAPPNRSTADAADRRWWILAVLGVAQIMVVLDATVVNIALPSAQRALHFSTADRQWVVTAYSLAFGSLLLLGGRLSDLFGRKRTLMIGLTGFALASAVGGAANGFVMLVAARAAQGAFGALLAPAALSMLTVTFSESEDRSKAFGIYGAIAGAGGAVGLIVGGLLTQYLDWRWCLYVNLLLAVVALVGATVLLPRQERDPSIHLDIPGTLTVIAGLVGVVYGFSEAETRGWLDPLTLGLIGAGLVLLAVFALIETRVEHPLLPMRIILDRNRGAADLAFLFAGIGSFGIFLFLTYYVQQVLGYTPFSTGLAFLPMIAALMLSSTVATAKLMPRFGPRWLVSSGLFLAAAGLVVFAQLQVTSTYLTNVVPGLVLVGLGLGLVFGTAMNAATYRAAKEDAGVASAMVNTGQQVGGSIGTALLNTLAASASATYLAHRVPSAANVVAGTVHGDVVAFWVTAGILAGAAILTAALFRPGRLEVDPSADPILAVA